MKKKGGDKPPPKEKKKGGGGKKAQQKGTGKRGTDTSKTDKADKKISDETVTKSKKEDKEQEKGKEEIDKEGSLPNLYRPKYNSRVYIHVSKYKDEHYLPFSRTDFIYFLEKMLGVAYFLELRSDPERGLYIIQMMTNDIPSVVNPDPLVVDNVFNHQVTITTKLPKNWDTHCFLKDEVAPPKDRPKVVKNAKVSFDI